MDHRRIFDAHTHIRVPGALDFMRSYIRDAGLEGLAIASFGCDEDGCCAEQNILPLLFKQREERIYAFGSLLYPSVPCEKPEGDWKPEKQAAQLLDIGCDGFKILESKPDSRKMVGLALDSPVYEPMFQLLEEREALLLWHVADPPEFWDAKIAPAFAVEAGWVYDDSFLSWEEIVGDVFRVLERHPRLRAVLAHFFFHSGSLEMAQAVMDRFPAVCFDLTPGIEMYENFSADPEGWRRFFIHNAGRILFGTDTDEAGSDIMCETEKSPALTVAHIRRFLETGEEFRFWDRPVRGLCLPEQVLDRIYYKNFYDIVPQRRPVDGEGLKNYARKYLDRVRSPEIRRWIREELQAGGVE